MLLPVSQVSELICLFFAFRFLSGKKNDYWGSFIWFMSFTVIVEITAYIMLAKGLNNHWLYNLYLPVEILFKLYLLYKICSSYFKVLHWMLPFLLLFLGMYIYESTTSHFAKYSFMSNAIISVCILLVCCFYFYHFLKKEEYVNIYEHGPFWVVTALFFFYLGGTACNLFFYYLADIFVQTKFPIRYIIFAFLNIIFYGCWSYSFLCNYRQTRSSSS